MASPPCPPCSPSPLPASPFPARSPDSPPTRAATRKNQGSCPTDRWPLRMTASAHTCHPAHASRPPFIAATTRAMPRRPPFIRRRPMSGSIGKTSRAGQADSPAVGKAFPADTSHSPSPGKTFPANPPHSGVSEQGSGDAWALYPTRAQTFGARRGNSTLPGKASGAGHSDSPWPGKAFRSPFPHSPPRGKVLRPPSRTLPPPRAVLVAALRPCAGMIHRVFGISAGGIPSKPPPGARNAAA